MHELLLFGQVPLARHDEIVKTLSSVAAMKPRPITERHLIFEPTKASTAKSGTMNADASKQFQPLLSKIRGDLFYLQLVADIDANDLQNSSQDSSQRSRGLLADETPVENDREVVDGLDNGQLNGFLGDSFDQSPYQWALEFRDLPEVPGRRPVTSRLTASVPIIEGNPLRTLNALGYTYGYRYEFVLRGLQLIYNNIILLLHRPYTVPSHAIPKSTDGSVTGPIPWTRFPPLETLALLDASGTFNLQASIRIQDGMNLETMSIAINELKAFKEMMKGIVEMEVGDRLALDTRVK